MGLMPALILAMQLVFTGYIKRFKVDTIFEKPLSGVYDYIIGKNTLNCTLPVGYLTHGIDTVVNVISSKCALWF